MPSPRLLTCLLLASSAATAAPAKRRADPDPAAMREAVGRAPEAGERYVSGRALEHYLRSRLALSEGDLERVISELKLAALYDSTNPFPRFALSKEYERRGELDAAEVHVKEALAIERMHVPSLVLSARLAFARGRPERALEPLRRAVQADAQQVEAFALLVRAHVSRHELPAALAVLDRLDGLALAASDREASDAGRVQRLAAEALTEVADALAAAGRDAKVEELLRKAMEREPGVPERVERLSGFLESKRRLADAAKVAAGGVMTRGASPALAARAARLFSAGGDAARAAAFVDVLCRFADDGVGGAPEEAVLLGSAYLQAHSWEPAAKLFDAATRAQPERADVHLLAGAAWESLGEFRKAEAAYGRVDEAHPLALAARAHGLSCAARAGEAQATEKLLALAATNHDDADPAQLYEIALSLQACGRRDEAIPILRRVLALEPEHVDAANVLAWLLAEARVSLEEAEVLAQRALAKRPADPSFLDTLGCVQLARGSVAKAVETLSRAAAAAPGDVQIRKHLEAAKAPAVLP